METHTINYTVKMKEYEGIVPNLTGSFNFTVGCPSTMTFTEQMRVPD